MENDDEKGQRERLIDEVRKKRGQALAVLPPSKPIERLGDGETLEDVIAKIKPHIREPEPEPEKPKPWSYERSTYHGRGIPPRIARMLHDGTTTNTSPVKALAAALRDGARTIVLWGNTGVGKSVAAARFVMAEYAYRSGIDCGPLFASTRHYLRALRNNGPVLKWLWHPDRVELSDRLALDEAGLELDDAKGWGPGEIGSLLCARHESELITVVTTNMKPDEFHRRYGDRVVARLQDGGVWLECDGPDLRGEP